MAAKKDKMIPSEKERKKALKYATPAGTGRMWVTMGIAFIIFGIILSLIPIGLVISEASAQRYDPESIHTATLVFYLLGAFFGFCGCFCIIFGKLAVKAFAKILCKGEINYPVAEYKTPKTRGFTTQPDKGELNEEAIENHHFRYPGRIWRYLVYRKPEAPGHDSARISRRVKCEKISKLCWKSSGIWSCRCLFLYLTLDIGMGI